MGIYRRALTRKMRTHIKEILAFGLDRKKKRVWPRDLNPDSTVYIVRHRKKKLEHEEPQTKGSKHIEARERSIGETHRTLSQWSRFQATETRTGR